MPESLVELRDRPVFICGHPKSGTSLLRSLLDSHPQLVVYPEESGFFRRFQPASQGLSLEEKLALAEKRLIHFFTWNQTDPPPSQAGFPDRDYSSVAYDEVRQAMHHILAELGCRHDGDLLSAAVLAYGRVVGQLSPQTHRWVEKTPYDERFARQIFSWWPEARCIHIVRDPRDNYLSYHRKHPEWTAEVFSSSWANSTRLGLRNVQQYGASRYWLLRFEDLAQRPGEVLPQLCRYLEITEHAALHTPTRKGAAWQGNSMFAERFMQISEAPVDRWKGILSPEEAGVIGLLSAGLMNRLGYSPSRPVAPRVYLRAAGWRVRRWLANARGKSVRTRVERKLL